MEDNMVEEWCDENGVSTFEDGTHSHCIAKTEDTGGIESKRFYLARTTALEMLRDRGYQVSDAELSTSLSELRSAFGEKPDLERLRICVPLRSDPKKKILSTSLSEFRSGFGEKYIEGRLPLRLRGGSRKRSLRRLRSATEVPFTLNPDPPFPDIGCLPILWDEENAKPPAGFPPSAIEAAFKDALAQLDLTRRTQLYVIVGTAHPDRIRNHYHRWFSQNQSDGIRYHICVSDNSDDMNRTLRGRQVADNCIGRILGHILLQRRWVNHAAREAGSRPLRGPTILLVGGDRGYADQIHRLREEGVRVLICFPDAVVRAQLLSAGDRYCTITQLLHVPQEENLWKQY